MISQLLVSFVIVCFVSGVLALIITFIMSLVENIGLGPTIIVLVFLASIVGATFVVRTLIFG